MEKQFLNSAENDSSVKEKDSTHHGHRRRMTENFMSVSNAPLTDVQIVEMLLFYCIPRSDTNPTAHRLLEKFKSNKDWGFGILLEKFKSIEAILRAEEKEISSVKGMGKASAKKLHRISDAFFKYSSLIQRSRYTGKLTKKQICDVILLSLRDSMRKSRLTPTFMLLCFSDSGKLLYRSFFGNRVKEHLKMLSLTYPRRDSSVSIFCISDTSLFSDPAAAAELSTLTKDVLLSFGIDLVAHVTRDLTIDFSVL